MVFHGRLFLWHGRRLPAGPCGCQCGGNKKPGFPGNPSPSGKQAQEIVRQVRPAVEGKLKVLVGFTLSDLFAEPFTFKNGDKAGETGISLMARLLRVSWAKVDGQPFYRERAA